MVTNRTFPPCSVKLQESLKALLYSSKFVVQSAMLSQTLISAWNYTLYIFFFSESHIDTNYGACGPSHSNSYPVSWFCERETLLPHQSCKDTVACWMPRSANPPPARAYGNKIVCTDCILIKIFIVHNVYIL